jgi:hypothetical protein
MKKHAKNQILNTNNYRLTTKKWAGLESNQRRLAPTGLQPVPFGRSGTDPFFYYFRGCKSLLKNKLRLKTGHKRNILPKKISFATV